MSAGDVLSSETRKCTSTLQIPLALEQVIKPHQRDGLHFLWDRLVDKGFLVAATQCRRTSVAERVEAYQRVFGALLGHSMGLGKTLTSLCFVMLLQSLIYKRIHDAGKSPRDPTHPQSDAASCSRLRVLVITTRSCIPHWEQSILEWVSERRGLFGGVHMPLGIPSYAAPTPGGLSDAALALLERFYREGGFLVLGYEEHRAIVRRLAESVQLDKVSRRSVDLCYRRVTSVLDHVRPCPDQLVKPRGSTPATLLQALVHCDVLLLDESHRLKKPASKTVSELKECIAHIPFRIGLTGTPLQNHLQEYLIQLGVVTGDVIDIRNFVAKFVRPIERGQCIDATRQEFDRMQSCVHRLRDFFGKVVHRCGTEILEASLPPRFETIIFVLLSPKQELEYRSMLQRRGESVAILQLHQEAARICAHPSLAPFSMPREDSSASSSDEEVLTSHRASRGGRSSRVKTATFTARHHMRLGADVLRTADISDSTKLHVCIEIIHTILRQREKVVVFAMYIDVLQLLEYFLRQRDIASFFLCGDTSLASRKAMIDGFHAAPGGEGPQVFLCSTKAGGVGINLLPANHCILLDTSWNPADDSQATFRMYRYGQTRPVYVYRLCCFGTAEHVVFSYSLRKEWLHKKVADLGDPERRERQLRRHYQRFPCSLPIAGWVRNPAFEECDRSGERLYSGSSDSDDSADGCPAVLPNAAAVSRGAPQTRCVDYQDFIKKCCPLLTHLAGSLKESVYAVVEHSFLLRDNSDEIISDLHKRLEMRALVASSLPRPDLSALKTIAVVPEEASGDTRQLSVFERTEAPLRNVADELVGAMWRQRCTTLNVDDNVLDRQEWEASSVALVSAVTRTAASSVRDDCCAAFPSLTDWVLEGYRRACSEFVEEVSLRNPDLKAFLEVRSRFLTRGAQTLRETLMFRGCTLWKSVPGSDTTRILTEGKFHRSFVPQMMSRGLTLLLQHFWQHGVALWREAMGLLLPSAAAALSSWDSVVEIQKECHAATSRSVEHMTDELWRPYEDIPPARVSSDDLGKATRALEDAVRAAPSPVPSGGSLLTLRQAARILGLPQRDKRGLAFGCTHKTCTRGVIALRSRAEPEKASAQHSDVTASCDLCHFSVEDALLSSAPMRAEILLERWSAGLARIGAFDVVKSLTLFIASRDADTSDVAAKILAAGCTVSARQPSLSWAVPRSSQPDWNRVLPGVLHRIPRLLLNLGSSVLCYQMPHHPVMLLAIQCGVRSPEELELRMQRYSGAPWELAQPVVRSMLCECCDAFRASSRHRHTRVPELLVLLALQYAAQREITKTCDVLDEAVLQASQADSDDDGPCDSAREGGRHLLWLTTLKEVFTVVAVQRYRIKLSRCMLPKAFASHRKRLRDAVPGEVRRPASEYMPWSRSSPQESSADGSDTGSLSLPSPPSVSDASDEEEELMHSLRTSTRVEQPPAWTDEETAQVSRHRQNLLWRSYVEVFGPAFMDTPFWLESKDAEEGPTLIIPDEADMRKLSHITPLTPMQAVDEFFDVMRDAGASIPLVQ